MLRTTRPTSLFTTNNNTVAVDDEDSFSSSSILSCRQQAKLTSHHPGVKLPPRLQDKSKKEQMERSCDRFKSYPNAVDTLYKTLTAISSHPLEHKYRIIDKTSRGYQRSLANVPGTEQLLRSINFSSSNNKRQLLILDNMDLKLVQMAMRCLERTKQTPEYQQGKKELDFAKQMNQIVRDDTSPTDRELLERKNLLAKCPREPSKGRGALIKIAIPTDDKMVVERRFDGDDTLQDVLHWLGGTMGTTFIKNLAQTRQWSLVDINRRDNIPLDCSDDSSTTKQTLQYLGLWPSGRLILRPSSQEWMEIDTTKTSSSAFLTSNVSPFGLGSAV